MDGELGVSLELTQPPVEAQSETQREGMTEVAGCLDGSVHVASIQKAKGVAHLPDDAHSQAIETIAAYLGDRGLRNCVNAGSLRLNR